MSMPANRAQFRLHVADFPTELRVLEFKADEALSQPYKIKLEVVATGPEPRQPSTHRRRAPAVAARHHPARQPGRHVQALHLLPTDTGPASGLNQIRSHMERAPLSNMENFG